MLGVMTAHTLPRRRPLRAALVVLTVGAMAATLAACGGGDENKSDGPSTQGSQHGKTLAAVWPLTGKPLKGSAPQRPIIAVKIPNTPEAMPQAGMGDADMVTEELVEGGITRLAVFYYSHVAKLAGPVRSMRASDIGIVRPLQGTIVSSGAAPSTLRRLTRAKVRFFTGGPGYYRESSRTAPYNLMVHLDQLARTLKKPKQAPASYLNWGKEGKFIGKLPAKSISATFSSYRTSQWAYRGGKYINTNSYEPANDMFKADTVLVLRVREGDAGYRDPAGNPVPETIMVGGGPAQVFHDGKVVNGTWSKKTLDSRIVLKTKKGKTIKVPPGKVYTELVPRDKDGGKVTWRR